jgi:hypothetical protein
VICFRNSGFGDGIEVFVFETGEILKSRQFSIRGHLCRVFEGKFGGFVVEPLDPDGESMQ